MSDLPAWLEEADAKRRRRVWRNHGLLIVFCTLAIVCCVLAGVLDVSLHKMWWLLILTPSVLVNAWCVWRNVDYIRKWG